MAISSVLIANARDADILEVAQGLTRLRREGAEYVGACPTGCAKHDGFAVNPKKQIFVCRPSRSGGDVIAMVQHARGLNFAEAIEFITGSREEEHPAGPLHQPAAISRTDDAEDVARRRRAALRIWSEAITPQGTLLDRYLASRHLELPREASHVFRFDLESPWREGEQIIRVPAMVCAMRAIDGDEIVAIHRTRLTPDGRKVDRRMLAGAAGTAIKLDPDDAVTYGLAVGEGVETCLAARQLGIRPIWALGSASAIERFPILDGIQTLTLLAEQDDSSREAVEACAARWHAAGREVIIVRPTVGKDVNDAIRSAAA